MVVVVVVVVVMAGCGCGCRDGCCPCGNRSCLLARLVQRL